MQRGLEGEGQERGVHGVVGAMLKTHYKLHENSVTWLGLIKRQVEIIFGIRAK